MAENIGVTRRALFNYEEGLRSFPGELLEDLVKRGDTDLCEFFAIPKEAADSEKRKADAQLAIALFRLCKEAFPMASDVDLQELAADRAAHWQRNLKATTKNLSKVAIDAVDELKDRYHEEAEREEYFRDEKNR